MLRGNVIWKPALASGGMALYLSLMLALHIHALWLVIPIAAIIYAAGLFAIMVWSEGDIDQVKQRYIHVWTTD